MATRKRSSKSGGKAKSPALTLVKSKATPKPQVVPPPVEIHVSEARLAPELEAQIQKPSVQPEPSPRDRRILEREERQRRKQAELAERRARREAANLGIVAPVPVELSQSNQPSPVPQRNLQAPQSPPDNASNGHMRLEIAEVLKYKMMAAEAEYKRLTEPIRQQCKMIAQAKLAEDIKNAVKNNPQCKTAAADMERCVNEILESVSSKLPPGYAVVYVNAKEGAVICKHAPQLAGKRFELA
jgi:hypothetical protein